MSGSIFIIGGGAVGTALGQGLALAGHQIAGVFSRTEKRARESARTIGAPAFHGELPAAIGEAEVILAAVPDPAVAGVAAAALRAGLTNDRQVWLHCAGALTTAALAELRETVRGVGSFHPALAFPNKHTTAIPGGARFAVAGDRSAIAVAEELARALEGEAVHVPDEARAAYHAALVIASNYQVALLAEARAILERSGIEAAQIEPLLAALGSSAITAAGSVGIDESLTGPIRRGDHQAVERHLLALADQPQSAAIYRALGRADRRAA
jgi:predicted short-subunit dehydrogenase-like oxidoreductase (DUF2520 family)